VTPPRESARSRPRVGTYRRAKVRVLVAVVAGILIAGCSAPAAPVAAPPSVAPPGTGAPTTAASPDEAACASDPGTADTVRGIAAVADKEPVLPAAVALLLLDARQKAAAPGLTDPALIAAHAEMVAAIDDLDAQGKAGLPAGGNAAQDKVKLDTTRIVTAVAAVERACAARR
jgi:hypothetical protein